VKLTPEEELRRAELLALKESKAEAKRLKQEEEKKAAEAAAAAAKKGGKGAKPPTMPTPEAKEDTEEVDVEEDIILPELPKSVDDDP